MATNVECCRKILEKTSMCMVTPTGADVLRSRLMTPSFNADANTIDFTADGNSTKLCETAAKERITRSFIDRKSMICASVLATGVVNHDPALIKGQCGQYAGVFFGVGPEGRMTLSPRRNRQNDDQKATIQSMIKQTIHQVTWRLEKVLDRMVGQRDKRRLIEAYIGYATPQHLVVRGRVLTSLRRAQAMPTQSRWANFKEMFALFLTDEVAGVTVAADNVTAVSDEEGYFTLMLPRENQSGWVDIDVTIQGQSSTAICPVMIANSAARFAVISDIDDTMLQTGAYSLVKNLWTSLTGNIKTRRIFPDAIEFMDNLSESGRNPIYYVSSSPWNLHHFLVSVFERSGLVRGPKFLRDLGVSETQFITGTHGDHKGASIDAIIAANPQLPVILVGDTGQHDAFVYADAIRRHGGQILAVVLREPGPGPDNESKQVMREIEESGTPLFHAPNFAGFAKEIQVLSEKNRRNS